MPKRQTTNSSLLLRAEVAALVLTFSTCSLTDLVRADDIRTLGNIGDAHKAVRLITKYTINTSTRSLDLIAATPTVSSLSKEQERQIAADTARQICAEIGSQRKLDGAHLHAGRFYARGFLPHGRASPKHVQIERRSGGNFRLPGRLDVSVPE